MKLNLLTPERKAVYDTEITEVTVPAYSGEMTILPGHSPLITTLGTGILKYKIKGSDRTHKAMISWGYCEVVPESVNVLAEYMQTPEEVVVADSQALMAAAEKKLGTEILADHDYEVAMQDIAKARASMDLVKN
ncbi:MAG: ATP synthase F1 subunit epsilon [Bdellovibrionales bacterium RIFCSPHIGHO2_01_FULL_40_29]|nr:MAG: ATP synthase F1 subunit epsilon [Bdellovibrionales bacterium RIFCSPHIGHO2_01_FULL_40_29]OFZ34696.1 MAG: ATP synthase F1 subunit epsilon [Bdellovibrionales bacterium RIFCSPHIGHO2_02_FULL_40_15]